MEKTKNPEYQWEQHTNLINVQGNSILEQLMIRNQFMQDVGLVSVVRAEFLY